MSDTGGFGAGRAVWLVARRELRTRLRSKAFLITTALMLVMIGGYFTLSTLLSANTSSSTVGFTAENVALAPALTAAGDAVGQHVHVRVVEAATGEKQVREGSLDALVTGPQADFQVVVKRSLTGGLANAFHVLSRQVALDKALVAHHVDPVAVQREAASAPVRVRTLQSSNRFNLQQLIFGIVVGVLLYFSFMVNGQSVAMGVVEEKASRVVELLLATLRPWQLMVGKVLGIGLVGLVQLVVFAAVGLGVGLGTGVLSLPAGVAAGTVVWSLAWYLVGFAMYALLFAAAGALVSRQEDAGGVTGPLLILIILPFVLGVTVLPTNPDSTLITVLSFIPLFSPMLMSMRLAIHAAPAWQGGVALALTVLTVLGLIWLTGRIYGNAVLRVGARVKLTDALRAA